MGRRRFSPKKERRFKGKRPGRPTRTAGRRPLEGALRRGLPPLAAQALGFLYGGGEWLSLNEIMVGLELAKAQRRNLEGVLAGLCEHSFLACREGRYRVARNAELIEGVVSMNPRGFGFASVERAPKGITIEQDLFIPPDALATANHGDRVLLVITGRHRGRFESQVVAVLARAATRLVGTYVAGRTTGYVQPEDERFPFHIVIRREHALGAKNGEAVFAEITDYRPESHTPEGRIVEVLGDPASLAVQTEMVIRKFELPHSFSDQAVSEAEGLDEVIRPTADRADLRAIPHVTIDGEDARDFDDAVAVEKTKRGYRLYVSIADVSHYIAPGSTLDNEAYLRGTSVYFPNRVVPMLPERLSNNLCSLVPDEDRYAFTAILDFDRQGRRRAKSFSRSVIRSHRRLTYTTVRQILVDNEQAVRRAHKGLLQPLAWMGELAAELEARRMERGSIGFELPEAKVELGPGDTIAGINRVERNKAHKLIEEFMLAANEAVAETLEEAGLDTLYRIHEEPDPVKVAEFVEFAISMGLKLPSGTPSPAWFGKVLKLVAGRPQEYIVNNLLLRTMQQARYASHNAGHFGLAASHYTHFTSPIRRYPDLIVHRVLARLIAAGGGQPAKKDRRVAPAGDLAEAGEFLSKRERVAIDAEREVVDRFKVRFMEGREGEAFTGVIAGVTSFGIFVELVETFVSGVVSLTDLRDDYYHLDDKHHRLVGKRSNRILQLGDMVSVRLKDVDVRRRHVNFHQLEKLEAAQPGDREA